MGVGAGRSRSAEELFAAAMAFFGFPLLDAIVLIGTDSVEDSTASLKLFPLLFAMFTAILCRVL
ncbi:MAG TPA: hypothetical protein VHF45_12045, partial [Thermoleophilaceae bacterium]|nr:hypothetical protein [Thermoleophilaceae bacterium]